MFFLRYVKNNIILHKATIVMFNVIIVLVKSLKFKRGRKSDNILIIALNRLGDAVFTIPAIKKIVSNYKKNIFLICFKETEPVYKIVFNSISYINLNHEDFLFKDRIAKRKAKKKLKALNPSIIYDLTGTITSASLLWNISAEKIIGLNEPYYRSIYTEFYSIRTKPHITDNYLDVVKKIQVPENNFNFVDESFSKEYILIHPFTSLKEKEWGLKKYISLAESLSKKNKCRMVSPKDQIENCVIEEIKKRNIDFVETESVSALINIIKKCSIFIGNDSGPTNIANLLGKPTFIIYGPTNPDFHKPIIGKNKFIQRKIKCSPQANEKMCFIQRTSRGCPSFECMEGLSVDEVKKSLIEFIESIERQN